MNQISIFLITLAMTNTITPIGTSGGGNITLRESCLPNRHQVLIGPTGSGKSAMALQIGISNALQGIGTTWLDNKRTTGVDFVGHVCEQGWRGIEQNLSVFDLNRGNLSLEILKPRFINGQQDWNHTFAMIHMLLQTTKNIIHIADTSIQNRRFKLLPMTLVFMATATKNGKYLELHNYHQAIDVTTRAHQRLLEDRLPLMHPKYAADWKQFCRQTPYQMSLQLESTENVLSKLVPPKTWDVLVNAQPGFDFVKAHRNSTHTVIVGEADGATLTEADLESQMTLIRTLEFHAAYSTPTPRRMIIEEANTNMSHDQKFHLERSRSKNVGLTLIFPGFSSVENEHFDIRPTLMTNCATIVCFGTNEPESRRYMRDAFFPSIANLRQKTKFQQLNDGVERVDLPTTTTTSGESTTVGNSEDNSVSDGQNWNTGVDIGVSSDQSIGIDVSETENESIQLDNVYFNDRASVGNSHKHGKSQRRGEGRSRSQKRSRGGNQTRSSGSGKSVAVSKNRQISNGRQVHFLSKYKIIETRDGWQIPKDMQEVAFDGMLSSLPPRWFIVKAGHFPVLIGKTHYLPRPFKTNQVLGHKKLKQLIEQLWQQNASFGPPLLTGTDGSSHSSSNNQRPSNKSKSKSDSLASKLREEGANDSNNPESSES